MDALIQENAWSHKLQRPSVGFLLASSADDISITLPSLRRSWPFTLGLVFLVRLPHILHHRIGSQGTYIPFPHTYTEFVCTTIDVRSPFQKTVISLLTQTTSINQRNICFPHSVDRPHTLYFPKWTVMINHNDISIMDATLYPQHCCACWWKRTAYQTCIFVKHISHRGWDFESLAMVLVLSTDILNTVTMTA